VGWDKNFIGTGFRTVTGVDAAVLRCGLAKGARRGFTSIRQSAGPSLRTRHEALERTIARRHPTPKNSPFLGANEAFSDDEILEAHRTGPSHVAI
jgi:hypothetical protein